MFYSKNSFLSLIFFKISFHYPILPLKLQNIAVLSQNMGKLWIEQPWMTNIWILYPPKYICLFIRVFDLIWLKFSSLGNVYADYIISFLYFVSSIGELPLLLPFFKLQTSQTENFTFYVSEKPVILINSILFVLSITVFTPKCESIKCIPVYFITYLSFLIV